MCVPHRLLVRRLLSASQCVSRIGSLPHNFMSAGVQQGLVRPPQIDKQKHTMVSNRQIKDGKLLEMWRIEINSEDHRITDLLARLISGVLYTNAAGLQNAEENVLGERGLLQETPSIQDSKDITMDPNIPKKAEDAVGNG